MDVVRQILEGRAAQFARHRIDVDVKAPATRWRIKAVKGMVIRIIENLLENSVYWLKIEGRRSRGFSPAITVELDPHTCELSVTDNGPGVAPDRAQIIFEPFVTSKPPGQGRGLGLYISREMARYHDWELALAPDETLHRGRLDTFVLRMDLNE
ncbi:MAG: sensor histidine kinase [Geminicoccaceae bacterium]